jgi:hypothetical protein
MIRQNERVATGKYFGETPADGIGFTAAKCFVGRDSHFDDNYGL